MQDFRVTRIGEGAYSILDAGDSSFYVVEGAERAAVIDTGITPGGRVMPTVCSLTDKPPVLILTHAHIDHMHHMDEFEEVYLCHEDLALPPAYLQEMMGGKDLKLASTRDMRTGTVIDLGGCGVEICQVPGHTPGSVAVLDTRRDLLFTGDAIGSGYGVWMQVPGALPLEDYLRSLTGLMKWLVDRGGRMRFWGGHSYQQFQSTLIPNYNPLSMGLLADLIDLVDGVVRGEIVGRASNADKVMSLEPGRYASFGRAELQYMASNIRRGPAR
ncbi:MAG: MBL fold metallo-hydrolase [Oscillospiraceae bacterium]|nr:MBL fold metallo-hydrolase [Oscillospiraceae bacterium]